MELSLSNFNTQLPKNLLKKAGKLTVRECDETEKGSFVAYVDELDKSYDVSLQTNITGVIESYTCDCVSRAVICKHVTALLIHIISRKPKKQVKEKVSSEAKKIESLIEATDQTALKEWLYELLLKNKDVAFSFTHRFSMTENDYTPAKVKSLSEEAAKSIVKNKKQVDLTQIKKLISMWTDIHAPIVKYYMANAADKDAFLIFHELLETCFSFHDSLHINSVRIPGYMKSLLEKTVAAVHEIIHEESWLAAVNYFIDTISDNYEIIRLQYVYHVRDIVAVSTKERRLKLLELLGAAYKKHASKDSFNSPDFTKAFFEMVKENGLFDKYHSDIIPIVYSNAFNVSLIESLIEQRYYPIAVKHCESLILHNVREEYNVPYLQLLKKIYILQDDKVNLAKILQALFPYSFDLDDFLFIMSQLKNDEEQKKFRTKMLSRARQASRTNLAAMQFIFKLADHEKNYKKMIGYIDADTPYKMILDYFEPMALTDKTLLLGEIIKRDDYYSWNFDSGRNEEDESCYPELAAKMVTSYTHDYLHRVIEQLKNNTIYHRPNKFAEFLRKYLAG
ncbi:MAG: hypothetical protein ABI402_07730 [Ferruginibacter sp.]